MGLTYLLLTRLRCHGFLPHINFTSSQTQNAPHVGRDWGAGQHELGVGFVPSALLVDLLLLYLERRQILRKGQCFVNLTSLRKSTGPQDLVIIGEHEGIDLLSVILYSQMIGTFSHQTFALHRAATTRTLREPKSSPFLLPELILHEYCCPCLGWEHTGWHLALLSCIRWRWHSTCSCPSGVDFVAVLMDACQSRPIECVWSSLRTSRNLIYFTNPDRKEVQPELICHPFATHHFSSSFSDLCNHTGKNSI